MRRRIQIYFFFLLQILHRTWHTFFSLRKIATFSFSPKNRARQHQFRSLLSTRFVANECIIHIWTLRNLNANCRRTRTARESGQTNFNFFFSFLLFLLLCSLYELVCCPAAACWCYLFLSIFITRRMRPQLNNFFRYIYISISILQLRISLYTLQTNHGRTLTHSHRQMNLQCLQSTRFGSHSLCFHTFLLSSPFFSFSSIIHYEVFVSDGVHLRHSIVCAHNNW